MAQIQTKSDTHRSYDPMAYPLFYPFGTDGWSLRYITSVPKLTLQKYLAYRIAPRLHTLNVLHHGYKLYQQWLVDQYCKMEMAKMQWFRISQSTIRADLY